MAAYQKIREKVLQLDEKSLLAYENLICETDFFGKEWYDDEFNDKKEQLYLGLLKLFQEIHYLRKVHGEVKWDFYDWRNSKENHHGLCRHHILGSFVKDIYSDKCAYWHKKEYLVYGTTLDHLNLHFLSDAVMAIFRPVKGSWGFNLVYAINRELEEKRMDLNEVKIYKDVIINFVKSIKNYLSDREKRLYANLLVSTDRRKTISKEAFRLFGNELAEIWF